MTLDAVRFYARRALHLGAAEDDVYDQVVQAVERAEAEREV